MGYPRARSLAERKLFVRLYNFQNITMPHRSNFLASLLCVLIIGSGVAAAEEKAAPDAESSKMGDGFAPFGLTTASSSTFKKTDCHIRLDLNQRKFVDTIPTLQKIGILNPDLTQTKINSMPNSISMVFIIQVLPVVIKNLYEDHPDVDRCQFEQFITRVDDYGNDKRELSTTFNFNRALYGKINWDNFEAAKLAKVAPGFRFTTDMMRSVTAEQ